MSDQKRPDCSICGRERPGELGRPESSTVDPEGWIFFARMARGVEHQYFGGPEAPAPRIIADAPELWVCPDCYGGEGVNAHAWRRGYLKALDSEDEDRGARAFRRQQERLRAEAAAK